MIFGDPSRFALSWDSVVAWDHQQPRFYEGLFLTYVNGLVVPWKNFGSSDIWFNLRAFNNAVIEHKRQKENKEFLGDDASVYRSLLFYSFGDESNWEYRADSDAITDAGFCLFLIKKKDEEIKDLKRDKKEMLINEMNPDWNFLNYLF